MKRSEIVEKSREILEGSGWTQGAYNDFGRHCLLGAAFRAATGRPVREYLPGDEVLLRDLVQTLVPGLSDGIIAMMCFIANEAHHGNSVETDEGKIILYNDKMATNVSDVLDFCDRAAKYWRDQGE